MSDLLDGLEFDNEKTSGGSLMVTFQRCRDCAYWTATPERTIERERAQWGKCSELSLLATVRVSDGRGETTPQVARWDGDIGARSTTVVMTGPEFGCASWSEWQEPEQLDSSFYDSDDDDDTTDWSQLRG